MQTYVLERSQWVPAPVAETFAFFSDAANLEIITPPWLQFRILSPLPLEVREGASLEYTLRLNNVGDFALPPSRVEALYAPEMFGEMPNARVKVEAAK